MAQTRLTAGRNPVYLVTGRRHGLRPVSLIQLSLVRGISAGGLPEMRSPKRPP